MKIFLATLLFTVTAGAVFPNTLFSRRDAQCNNYQQVLSCVPSLQVVEAAASLLFNINTPDDLDKKCRVTTEMLVCVYHSAENCDEPNLLTKVLLQILSGVMDHTCSRSGREILAESHCWHTMEFQTESAGCTMSSYDDLFQPCEYLARVQHCIKSSAEDHCTPRAASFVNNLLYYALHPAAEEVLKCGDVLALDYYHDHDY